MANWNLPTTTSNYINFVAEMNAKFVDAATLQFGSPTNIPDNTIRWNRSTNTFQEWLGTTLGWQNKILSIAGGGTGASTPGDIRINLGLGSMATQNSNAVNITGGVITGVTIDIASTTGIIPLARGGTGASLALGSAGEVLLSNGSSVVFQAGTGIGSLNASNLTTGIVPAARLSNVAVLVGSNVFTGFNIFDGVVDQVLIRGTSASLLFRSTASPPTSRDIRLYCNTIGDFQIMTLNAAGSVQTSIFYLASNGILTVNGGGITNLNAASLASGIVPTDRLGSGTANSTTILYGDNVWRTAPSGGGGGGGEIIPVGLIALFDTACPAGWTRVSALDGRYPMGSTSWGAAFGTDRHIHTQSGFTQNGGVDHTHLFSKNVGIALPTGNQVYGDSIFFQGGSNEAQQIRNHGHNVTGNVLVEGDTNPASQYVHAHQVTHNVNEAEHIPPTLTVVYCRKS